MNESASMHPPKVVDPEQTAPTRWDDLMYFVSVLEEALVVHRSRNAAAVNAAREDFLDRLSAALASEAPAEAPTERMKALAEDIRDGGYKDGYAAGLAAAAEAGSAPLAEPERDATGYFPVGDSNEWRAGSAPLVLPEPPIKAGEQGAREQLLDLFDEYADATLDHIDWKRIAEISGRIVAALASEAPAEAGSAPLAENAPWIPGLGFPPPGSIQARYRDLKGKWTDWWPVLDGTTVEYRIATPLSPKQESR